MRISNRTFFSAVSALVFAALCVTAYTFLVRQNYNFIVEAPCDSAAGPCFARDCEMEECPLSGLESYRVFGLSRRDFATCGDNSCLQECTSGVIECTEYVCGESEEDMCAEAE